MLKQKKVPLFPYDSPWIIGYKEKTCSVPPSLSLAKFTWNIKWPKATCNMRNLLKVESSVTKKGLETREEEKHVPLVYLPRNSCISPSLDTSYICQLSIWQVEFVKNSKAARTHLRGEREKKRGRKFLGSVILYWSVSLQESKGVM